MAVRTKRLAFGAAGAAGASVVIYTAPVAETVIVKDVRLWGASAAAGRAVITVQSGPTGVALVDRALGLSATHREECWVVLQPGDQMRAFTDVAGAYNYWVSGTELEGVAD